MFLWQISRLIKKDWQEGCGQWVIAGYAGIRYLMLRSKIAENTQESVYGLYLTVRTQNCTRLMSASGRLTIIPGVEREIKRTLSFESDEFHVSAGPV
jgi:hypothetical protein